MMPIVVHAALTFATAFTNLPTSFTTGDRVVLVSEARPRPRYDWEEDLERAISSRHFGAQTCRPPPVAVDLASLPIPERRPPREVRVRRRLRWRFGATRERRARRKR